MIRKLATTLRRWAGRSEAEEAAQPLLAGYHRTPPRWIVYGSLAALAIFCLVYGLLFGVMAPARMMPFLAPMVVLGGLILWCLPPGEYAPTRALEPLFVAFFAALILWPNYLAIAVANLPWITMLRLTGTPMVLIFLACISISASFRRHLWEIVGSEKVMFRLVVGLAALWTFSLAMSSEPGDSINRYALAMVNLIGVFFVSCYLFSREGFADLWVRLLLIITGFLAAVGAWEAKIQKLPWAGHIPSFLKVDDPIVQKILAGGMNRAEVYRVKATATTPLGLSELLGLAMPFALHMLIGKYPLYLRLGAALMIPFTMWVILLTDSRLGFVAACASGLFYLLFWALLRWRQDKRSLLAPALVLSYPAIFVSFMIATFAIGRLRAEFWGTGQQQYSTQGRIDQWYMGMPKVLKNPLGYGIGQGGKALGFKNLAGVGSIDSYWLSVLLEIGVVGFLVFYGLMLRGAFTAARTLVATNGKGEMRLLLPMAVALLNFIIVKMVLSQDANHPLIFMILGAVVALNYRAKQQMAQQPVLAVKAVETATRRLTTSPPAFRRG
ncbi:MAG: O-antigen ligase family protein [Pseudomonadota bacterium]